MASRSRILPAKFRRNEQELHILTNPLVESTRSVFDDYQAPLTAHSLAPNSKWLLVRNNLHKIRSWGGARRLSGLDERFQDWYIFFQMRRELRRAQMDIKTIQDRPDFKPVRHFSLPIGPDRFERYKVSHVEPSDVIYYPGSGPEPIVLESLLYYFSKECKVPYSSIFRGFLSDVCSILDQDRERQNRVAVFRRIALALAVIVFVILGMMFLTLIFSTLKTISNIDEIYRFDMDGGIDWRPPSTSSLQSALNLS